MVGWFRNSAAKCHLPALSARLAGIVTGAAELRHLVLYRKKRQDCHSASARSLRKGEGVGGNTMPYVIRLAGLVVVVAAALPVSGSSGQVLMQRDVSLHMALKIAETAIDDCTKSGNDVSVAVVDRAGRLRVFLQGDKAAPHNIELAQRKAYTARTFGRTSAEWAERTGPNSELAGQRELEHVIPLRGGVPIKVGTETIGAVGVSGSTSGGDESCAMAGVAKVAEQLK